jgi:hypothetical protein
MTICHRIVAIPAFHKSVEALGDATVRQFVYALLEELAMDTGLGVNAHVPDLRVLRTRAYGPYPALSIYYQPHAEVLYAAMVEPYDPLPVIDPEEPGNA